MNSKIQSSLRAALVICILFACISLANFSFSKQEDLGSNSQGEKLYKANCAGCHINGQNLIKSDKPVVGSIKIKSKAIFKEFLKAPPKPMPSFENITGKEEKLDALYRYVISLTGK